MNKIAQVSSRWVYHWGPPTCRRRDSNPSGWKSGTLTDAIVSIHMFRLIVTGLEGEWSEIKLMLSDIGHVCFEMNPLDLISIRMNRSDSF